MDKMRLIRGCVPLTIILVSALAACSPASQLKPATTVPPAATTTPADPSPSANHLSFSPTKYINDEYGFYVLYPDTMQKRRATSQWSVLDAAGPSTVPSIGVSVEDSGHVEENTIAVYKALGGTNINKVSEDAVKLADGKTGATLTKRTWQIGGVHLITLTLIVEKGNKTIAFSYSNIDSRMDEKAAKEILYTLTLTN